MSDKENSLQKKKGAEEDSLAAVTKHVSKARVYRGTY